MTIEIKNMVSKIYPVETMAEEAALKKHRQTFQKQGYDAEHNSFPNYILGITHRIWEEREVQSIKRYYHPKIKLTTNDFVLTSNESVVGDTLALLHMFPNRKLLGDDVIWGQRANQAYLSSHRIVSTMNHYGDGVLGKATGRRVLTYAYADCYAKQNRIFEEWLVRDWLGVLLQLGVDAKAYAQRMAEDEWKDLIKNKVAPLKVSKLKHAIEAGALKSKGLSPQEASIAFAATNPSIGTPVMKDVQEAVVSSVNAFKAAWEEGALAGFAWHLHPAARAILPAEITAVGREQFNNYLFKRVGALSGVKFHVASFTVTSMPQHPLRIALRFHVAGRNMRKVGLLNPCKELLYFFGIMHLEFYGRQIKNVWLGIDEVSLQKQIFMNKIVKAAS